MRRIVWGLALLMLAGCVKKPQKNYVPSEIAKLEDLQELMRVQADRMDPMFAIRDKDQFDDEEFARMSKAADILKATSARLESFEGQGEGKYDDGFTLMARKQGEWAAKLYDATTTNSPGGVREALEAMRSNCKACHGVYR